MDKLALKHLAPYLPYGLKVIIKNKIVEVYKACATSIETIPSVHGFTYCPFNDFKPILRPLSDLTKEIEHNGESFVPISQISEMYGFDMMIDGQKRLIAPITLEPYNAIRQLFEWHFDVFGLIAAGLAVYINTLEGGASNG